MPVDHEKISVEFHIAARAVFFQLSKRFQKDIKPVSRELDENVFQQQKARYMYTLKTRLDDLAIGMLDKYKHDVKIDVFRITLTGHIQSYLNEFEQKSRFL